MSFGYQSADDVTTPHIEPNGVLDDLGRSRVANEIVTPFYLALGRATVPVTEPVYPMPPGHSATVEYRGDDVAPSGRFDSVTSEGAARLRRDHSYCRYFFSHFLRIHCGSWIFPGMVAPLQPFLILLS